MSRSTSGVKRERIVKFTSAVIVSAALLSAGNLMAQVPPPLESYVLVPVYSGPISGAHGSLWTTEFALRNDNQRDIVYTPLACPAPCAGGMALMSGESSLRADPAAPETRFVGRLMRFEPGSLDGISFALRIRDLSRQSRSAGVEIPVVREGNLATRIVLPSVRIDPRFRHTLRIYDTSTMPAPAVRLRIFSFHGEDPLVDDVLWLAEPPDRQRVAAMLTLGYLTLAYPQLATVSDARIEIDAISSESRMWAFAAIVNNETQEVTTVTPQ